MKKFTCVLLLSGLAPGSGVAFAQTKLSVGEAVSYALAHRAELRSADARVSASEQLRKQAALLPNPRFIFRKEDLRPQTSAFGANSQTYWEANELVENSGRRGGRIAVANAGIEGSRLQRELQHRQIALAVRLSYWKARSAQALGELFDEDARYFQQMISYHEARFREGKIAEVDLLRIRLQGQQTRAAAANAHLDAERSKLDLAKEMNAADPTHLELTDSLEYLELPAALPANADPVLLRPEGQVAKQAIAQAQAQTKLERANGRPDLIFTGGYKRDVNLDAPLAGVQLDLPFFNRNQGAVAAAKAQTDAAQADYEATQKRLLAELALARKEYELRLDQFQNVFRPLNQEAVNISDISRAAYQAGGLDLVRLLDAERARIEAQESYVRALESYHLSVAQLNFAEGMNQ